MPTQRQQYGLDTLADVSCGNINRPTHPSGYELQLQPRDGCGLPSTSDSRQGHNVTTNGAKSWDCADCGMTFLQSKLLATHARNTKHKAYRCSNYPTCTKTFGMRTAASRHEAQHSALMNHACSQCGKRFRRRDHCLEHEEICPSLPLPTQRRESSPANDLGVSAPISSQRSEGGNTTNSDTFASTSAEKDSQPGIDTTTPDHNSLRYHRNNNDLAESRPTHFHDARGIRRIPSDTTSTGASTRELPAMTHVTLEGQQFHNPYLALITPPHPGFVFPEADQSDKTQSATHSHNFFCHRCDQHFEYSSERQWHIREHHPAESAETSQQDYNNALTPSRAASTCSQKDPRAWYCNLCTKSFTRAYTLREHLRTHDDDREFVCTVCGKAFIRQHDRKRHEALHGGEKKFACRGTLESGAVWGCGRMFSRAEALGRHSRSEGGQICFKPIFDEIDEEDTRRTEAWRKESKQAQVATTPTLNTVPNEPWRPPFLYCNDIRL